MEAEAPAFMVVETNALLNGKSEVALGVPAAAMAMALARGSSYCQETKISRRGQPEKRQGSYRLQQICELRQTQW